MKAVRIRLFGKFEVARDGRAMVGLDALKVQELFCYLLLNRDRPHHREALAGLLWGDHTTSQSKKYLRQALWQLQLALDSASDGQPGDSLMIDPDWASIVSSSELWLDVQVFDEAMTHVRGIPGKALEIDCPDIFIQRRQRAVAYQPAVVAPDVRDVRWLYGVIILASRSRRISPITHPA